MQFKWTKKSSPNLAKIILSHLEGKDPSARDIPNCDVRILCALLTEGTPGKISGRFGSLRSGVPYAPSTLVYFEQTHKDHQPLRLVLANADVPSQIIWSVDLSLSGAQNIARTIDNAIQQLIRGL